MSFNIHTLPGNGEHLIKQDNSADVSTVRQEAALMFKINGAVVVVPLVKKEKATSMSPSFLAISTVNLPFCNVASAHYCMQTPPQEPQQKLK